MQLLSQEYQRLYQNIDNWQKILYEYCKQKDVLGLDSLSDSRLAKCLRMILNGFSVSAQRYDGRFLLFDRHDKSQQPSTQQPATAPTTSVGTGERELDERLAETVRRFLYERGEYGDEKFADKFAAAAAAAAANSNALNPPQDPLNSARPVAEERVATVESSGANGRARGDVYAVVRVVPEIGQQLAFLEKLERDDAADLRLNFWTSPIRVGSAVDVMVPYDKLEQIQRTMKQNDLQPDLIIEDVEKLIIERERKMKKPFALRYRDAVSSSSAAANGHVTVEEGSEKNRRSLPTPETNEQTTGEAVKRLNSGGGGSATTETPTGGSSANYDFHRYGSYAQMVAWMRSLAHRHPNFVQFISIGKTHEGRSIDGLEIGTHGLRKRAFWIDGGIHAREWAAPHTALYFIHQLTSRYGQDANVTRLVSELTWIIIPLLNPDGYEYTRLSTNPNVRLWRKNRAPTQCIVDQWGRNRCCKGVDLNRNFDFHFKESGSSDDPCSEIYQGKGPFSEPESKAVRDAILSSRYRSRVDGFITLHTYSQIWIHPYGHKKDSYPGDVHDLYSVGKKATVALSKLYGTKYILGSGADTLYPASGGSEDWAKESAAIKFVYLLELRPDERSWDGFILDETQLIPTASETWAGVKVVAEAIIQRAHNRVQPAQRIAGLGTKQYQFGNGTPGSCYDLRHACKRWINENEALCTSVPVFMREQCAYSCGYC